MNGVLTKEVKQTGVRFVNNEPESKISKYLYSTLNIPYNILHSRRGTLLLDSSLHISHIIIKTHENERFVKCINN